MATELPRPGVEVVQRFESASPTIVTPTLVPCNVAPYFEIIEVLTSGGTLNPDAKLHSPYEQIEMVIDQSSFPSPRGNIDEVDVLEDTIRAFFEFGGDLVELSRTSGFLVKYNDPEVSTQPWVIGEDSSDPTTSGVEPVGGYGLDGKTLILCMNAHTSLSDSDFISGANLPTVKNVPITFKSLVAGGHLTIQEVVDQINALLPKVASSHDGVFGKVLKLSATKYGAGASVVVRWNGATANSGEGRLGFSPIEDTIAVGSGFYAADDGDGDSVSPRLKIYQGATQSVQSVFPVGPQTSITAPFLSSNIESGDTIHADGVNIGSVVEVESHTLTMEIEQNLISHDRKFAPRRVWALANSLAYPAPASSIAAHQTGSIQTSSATPAYIVSQQPSMMSHVGPGESFEVNIVKGGVSLPTATVTSGTGWADLPEAVAGINGTPGLEFSAYYANEYGDEVTAVFALANPLTIHLGLRTKADNTGSASGIILVSSTIATQLGFTALPSGDVGENVRYTKGTPAIVVGQDVFFATVALEFITYTALVSGLGMTETVTWAASHADLGSAIIDWNNQARYTRAYKADSLGVPSETGMWFAIRTMGENLGTAAQITVSATDSVPTLPLVFVVGWDTNLDSQTFKWLLDGSLTEYEVIFVTDEDDDGVSFQQVLDKINAETPGIAKASPESPPFLKMESNKVGNASQVKILNGTANDHLGFATSSSTSGTGRPAPDLAVDISGNVIVQSQLLFDGLTATPFSPGSAPLLIAYKALRLDLSPEAVNPALLRFTSTEVLEAAAGPISSENPGALMCFLSLINAPTIEITSIGVPEISANAPDGTPLGYAKCAEFLENEEVYALATASQLPTVHQTFMTHVNAMSEPEQKGERIYFFNPKIPTRALPKLIGSGTDANSTPDPNELVLEVNIAPMLIAAGLDPNEDLNPSSGAIQNEVYIDLGSDDKHYLVQRVNQGTRLVLRTDFYSDDGNSDNFFSNEDLPTGVISDDWTVYIRGNELVIPGTTRPDRSRIAETIQTSAQAYGFRRAFWVFPDQCAINVTGLEQVVPGYYATACVAGMVGQLPPQQGFTNYPITGLTRVVGSNDKFTEKQLNVIAGGGVYILVQDASAAPVVCRHQLSTDLSSIETRELSITKVVDYTAKFLRAGLRSFIGRSNITQPFMDKLSMVTTGLLSFLYDSPGGVLIGAEINNLIQDADQPDTILADITLDVPYPCNFIRVTLII